MNDITKTLCPDHQRLDFMPKFIGRKFMTYESALFKSMRQYCPDYTGGYWNSYSLSNGGFYTALNTENHIEIQNINNYYKGIMSADAAGIAINLMVQNAFAWQMNADYFSDMFYLLCDYAYQHKEHKQILRFID